MRALGFALAALVALAAPSIALAQPRDPAAAEVLFTQARALRAEGRYKEACPKFAESYRLDPALGALLNLASCHELEGRTATAWAEFRSAAEEAKRARDGKREAFANGRAAALEPRLVHLTIRAADSTVLVTRDGERLATAALGVSVPVDPGSHVIAATAEGYAPFRRALKLAEGESTTVDVPRLDPLPAEPVAPVAPPAPPSAFPARTVAVVAAGVGLIGIGVGATFGALTGGAARDAKQACPNDACSPAGLADVDHAKGYAWASDIGFITGGVALAAAGVLYFTSKPAAPRPAAALRFVPRGVQIVF